MTEAFTLHLPATSANLGPAFDTAAMALDFGLRVEARPAKRFILTAAGRDSAICSRVKDHLILDVYRRTVTAAGKAPVPLELNFENGIPIGRGCGSSAAARLAGLALASHFGRLQWSADKIFEESVKLEGHADNVAACWWGGLVMVHAPVNGEPAGEATWVRVPVPSPRAMILAVPSASLATEKARAALPDEYRREDVVRNLQNALLLIQAFEQGGDDLLIRALDDRLHQPYRAALCPALPILKKVSGRQGILGVVLSGAGPSVLAFLRSDAVRPAARATLGMALKRAQIDADLLDVRYEPHGPGQDWSRG